MDDFTSNFQRVEICNVIPEGKSGEAKVWQDKLLRGAWKKKVNAGGCRNNPGWKNNMEIFRDLYVNMPPQR